MLVEIVVMSIVLSRPPKRCEAGESIWKTDSATDQVFLTSGGSAIPELLQATDLEGALARDLAFVREVRHVMAENAEGNLLVWIALDNPTRAVREEVFKKELSLIEGFPEVNFDFNIVPSFDREPREISSSGKIIYSREDAGAQQRATHYEGSRK